MPEPVEEILDSVEDDRKIEELETLIINKEIDIKETQKGIEWYDWMIDFKKKFKEISNYKTFKERKSFIQKHINKVVIKWNKNNNTHKITIHFNIPIVKDERLWKEKYMFEIMKGKREMMHKYSPELAEELRESFGILDDNYIRGTMFNEPTYNGRELVHQSPDNFKDLFGFIQNNYKNFNDFTLYSHVLLTYIFIHEQDIFLDFMNNFIRPKRKLFIGSIKKSSIQRLVGEVH